MDEPRYKRPESPLMTFLRNHCEADPCGVIPRDVLQARLKELGQDVYRTSWKITNELTNHGLIVKKIRQGKRVVRCLVGFRLL